MFEPTQLTVQDRLLLIAVAFALGVSCVVVKHPPGLYEAVFAQSLREMSASGRWFIPTVGQLPWLSAAPLAQWMGQSVTELAGISDPLMALRISGIIPLIFATVWTASFATTAFGRRCGLLAGFILMTTLGVTQNVWYGGNVIWLVAAGSGLMRLLASLEERTQLSRYLDSRPVGSDTLRTTGTLTALSVFTLLGLSALIAGPVAALTTVVLPSTGHVFLRQRSRLRSAHPWHIGWILTAALLLSWPAATCLHSPGLQHVWTETVLDGFSRWSPIDQAWQMIQLSMPWLPLTVFGQWSLRHDAFAGSYSRERLLACWSVGVPMAVFLMLPTGTPLALAAAGAWSISAAVGLERLMTRVFAELPHLQNVHNRGVFQRFVVSTAAVLTLTVVWSDRGPGSQDVDRELLTHVRSLAEEGHMIRVDMSIGEQAAVLLLELGDSAEPLTAVGSRFNDPPAIVISRIGQHSGQFVHRKPPTQFRSGHSGEVTTLQLLPASSAADRIADASPMSPF